jgi:hypothetical protein
MWQLDLREAGVVWRDPFANAWRKVKGEQEGADGWG